MPSESLYHEEQTFDQPWLTRLILFVLIVSVAVSFLVFVKTSAGLLSFLTLVPGCAVFVLFKMLKLIVTIDGEKVGYQFYPVQVQKTIIRKGDIKQISVEEYKPISQYGGWGIRFGPKGRAYTVRGQYGMSIRLANNKNILIGTQKPDEVYAFLTNHGYDPAGKISASELSY